MMSFCDVAQSFHYLFFLLHLFLLLLLLLLFLLLFLLLLLLFLLLLLLLLLPPPLLLLRAVEVLRAAPLSQQSLPISSSHPQRGPATTSQQLLSTQAQAQALRLVLERFQVR